MVVNFPLTFFLFFRIKTDYRIKDPSNENAMPRLINIKLDLSNEEGLIDN